MQYLVRHVTRFRYSAPITESVMEVRLHPRQESTQQCLSFDLTTTPGAQIMSNRDYLGNTVHHFSIPRSHTELTITAQALVSVTDGMVPQQLGHDAWSELDDLANSSDMAEMLVPSHFAQPTQLLRRLGYEFGISRRQDPLTMIREINAGVHGTFAYTPLSTRVDSPIDEALQKRQGVCQDFAHVMIALVRELGIPCRYVSGYLYRPSLVEAQQSSATHAWVETLLPGFGWIGFDPTNNGPVGEHHIRIAVGRDYADVPPTRGVFKGRSETELGIAVQVVRADEQLVSDDLLLNVQQVAPPQRDGEQPQQQQQSSLGLTCHYHATRYTR